MCIWSAARPCVQWDCNLCSSSVHSHHLHLDTRIFLDLGQASALARHHPCWHLGSLCWTPLHLHRTARRGRMCLGNSCCRRLAGSEYLRGSYHSQSSCGMQLLLSRPQARRLGKYCWWDGWRLLSCRRVSHLFGWGILACQHNSWASFVEALIFVVVRLA